MWVWGPEGQHIRGRRERWGLGRMSYEHHPCQAAVLTARPGTSTVDFSPVCGHL